MKWNTTTRISYLRMDMLYKGEVILHSDNSNTFVLFVLDIARSNMTPLENPNLSSSNIVTRNLINALFELQ